VPDTPPEEAAEEEVPGILDYLEEALTVAEDVALPPTPAKTASRIREELVVALLEARTHVEVGRVAAPEVRLSLSQAVNVAAALADGDPRFAPLLSRVTVAKEQAGIVARQV
jgi:hypothetical protein